MRHEGTAAADAPPPVDRAASSSGTFPLRVVIEKQPVMREASGVAYELPIEIQEKLAEAAAARGFPDDVREYLRTALGGTRIFAVYSVAAKDDRIVSVSNPKVSLSFIEVRLDQGATVFRATAETRHLATRQIPGGYTFDFLMVLSLQIREQRYEAPISVWISKAVDDQGDMRTMGTASLSRSDPFEQVASVPGGGEAGGGAVAGHGFAVGHVR